jgi:2-polyprenyl-3-methyl-5-hydroxy-6-metoxy-1,4-benzoquinol methylase
MIAELGCDPVIGCDISEEALDLCRKYNDHPCIEWKQISITDLKKHFAQTFDAIVCFETLEHIAEGQEQVLQDFKDITKPGSPIITSIPLNHPDTTWHLRQFNFEQRDKMYREVFDKYEYPEENKSLVIAWNE